jgi:hypothetical protein
LRSQSSSSLSLEEEDGAVAEVEVDEVLRLCGDGQLWISIEISCSALTMSDEAAEVSANNTVPGSALSGVELDVYERRIRGRGRGKPDLFLDVLCDVLRTISQKL